MRSTGANQPQSPQPVPRLTKKRKENKTRAYKTKAAGAGLEDFMA